MESFSIFHLAMGSVLIAIPLYFVPTIIAVWRGHPQRVAIIALNVLLGWTLIGWGVALVWSLMTTETLRPNAWGMEPSPPPSVDARRPCPECGESIALTAKRCRFCDARFDVPPSDPAISE